MTQLYSFTGSKIAQDNSENKSNQHIDKQRNSISDQQKDIVHQTSSKQKTKIPQKERNNRKIKEKNSTTGSKEKFEHRETSRLRIQPRKNYKTFIPQSKILKKVEFQK